MNANTNSSSNNWVAACGKPERIQTADGDAPPTGPASQQQRRQTISAEDDTLEGTLTLHHHTARLSPSYQMTKGVEYFLWYHLGAVYTR